MPLASRRTSGACGGPDRREGSAQCRRHRRSSRHGCVCNPRCEVARAARVARRRGRSARGSLVSRFDRARRVGVAFLFPGQGSQYPDMLARVASDANAAQTFEEARSVLGYDVRDRDDVTALASTVNVQLGLLVGGVASARVLAAYGVRPDAVAGHSVGGFAAAVTARRDAVFRCLTRRWRTRAHDGAALSIRVWYGRDRRSYRTRRARNR